MAWRGPGHVSEWGHKLDGPNQPERVGMEFYYPNGQVMARLGQMPGVRGAEDFEDALYNVQISGTWTRDSTRAHGGSWSFRSATITDGQTSDATVTVPVGATTMSFWYFTDTEAGFDGLSVLLDGVATSFFVSGQSTAWAQPQAAFDVTGVSTVTFRYKKDSSNSTGADAVWIDDLTFSSSDNSRVGMEICDETGTVKVLAGELTDGDYGLAVVNADGQLTKLGDFIFGPRAASDPAMGTRSSSAFGDLTGAAVGPSVTVNIGETGRALVFWSAQYGYTGGWETLTTAGVSVQVSGATSIAPSANYTLGHRLEITDTVSTGDALLSFTNQSGMMHFFQNLNPGLNTFTLKYRNVEGTNAVQFETREIAVFPF